MGFRVEGFGFDWGGGVVWNVGFAIELSLRAFRFCLETFNPLSANRINVNSSEESCQLYCLENAKFLKSPLKAHKQESSGHERRAGEFQ